MCFSVTTNNLKDSKTAEPYTHWLYTVKNRVLRHTFAMVLWDAFIYVGVT